MPIGNRSSRDFEDSKEEPSLTIGRQLAWSESSEKEQLRKQRERENAAFDTSEDPRYYKPIPTYEGFHRWDPDFEWTEEEEKKIVRKVREIAALQRLELNVKLTWAPLDRLAGVHVRMHHFLCSAVR